MVKGVGVSCPRWWLACHGLVCDKSATKQRHV